MCFVFICRRQPEASSVTARESQLLKVTIIIIPMLIWAWFDSQSTVLCSSYATFWVIWSRGIISSVDRRGRNWKLKGSTTISLFKKVFSAYLWLTQIELIVLALTWNYLTYNINPKCPKSTWKAQIQLSCKIIFFITKLVAESESKLSVFVCLLIVGWLIQP